MSEHTTFHAENPMVSVSHGDIVLSVDTGWNNGPDKIAFTPDEAIALGYALFSIGLTLKGK